MTFRSDFLRLAIAMYVVGLAHSESMVVSYGFWRWLQVVSIWLLKIPVPNAITAGEGSNIHSAWQQLGCTVEGQQCEALLIHSAR